MGQYGLFNSLINLLQVDAAHADALKAIYAAGESAAPDTRPPTEGAPGAAGTMETAEAEPAPAE